MQSQFGQAAFLSNLKFVSLKWDTSVNCTASKISVKFITGFIGYLYIDWLDIQILIEQVYFKQHDPFIFSFILITTYIEDNLPQQNF